MKSLILCVLLLLVLPITTSADIHTQCLVESSGNPNARSKIGKKSIGLCQIRPTTFRYVTTKLMPKNIRRRLYIRNGKDNMYVAKFYMDYLENKWQHIPSESDRYRLALASYNAGLSNVMKAEKRSGGAKSYSAIIAHLPSITHRYSKITMSYVNKIANNWS
jgi:soluble lytic murein transglycosylase-like protein